MGNDTTAKRRITTATEIDGEDLVVNLWYLRIAIRLGEYEAADSASTDLWNEGNRTWKRLRNLFFEETFGVLFLIVLVAAIVFLYPLLANLPFGGRLILELVAKQ